MNIASQMLLSGRDPGSLVDGHSINKVSISTWYFLVRHYSLSLWIYAI